MPEARERAETQLPKKAVTNDEEHGPRKTFEKFGQSFEGFLGQLLSLEDQERDQVDNSVSFEEGREAVLNFFEAS